MARLLNSGSHFYNCGSNIYFFLVLLCFWFFKLYSFYLCKFWA
ncbi:DUF599 family protein [Flavobacterium psychrophilum]|nr:DUF599 family protein [Flavobacterium psychrophilum]EKT4498236.1 DUF599 family protein [Flavobacterium psychrophilum]ELM3649137.1 DUF599 family protein [Flavobacterium psychrophilum]ELM3670803.1 DUF599 family protein [Flavobacterium psychrophilum]ELM3724696.1 DUF599 family protein [Flavobacterium psychrophilum]